MRVGLGYVKGLKERDAEVVVAERERGGPYRDLGELASRSGASRDALERLAWAGACSAIGGSTKDGGSAARAALAARRRPRRDAGSAAATSSPCRSRCPRRPRLAEQTPWERVMADYGAYGMSLDEHPLELIRPSLDPATVTCAALERIPDGLAGPRRRHARRPPAPGDGEGRDVPAARGRDRRRERDRPAARLRRASPHGADRLAGLDPRQAGAPRGRDQRRRLSRPPDRAARRAAGRGPDDRALSRSARRGRRSPTWTRSSPPFNPSAEGLVDALFTRSCKNACTEHLYVRGRP